MIQPEHSANKRRVRVTFVLVPGRCSLLQFGNCPTVVLFVHAENVKEGGSTPMPRRLPVLLLKCS